MCRLPMLSPKNYPSWCESIFELTLPRFIANYPNQADYVLELTTTFLSEMRLGDIINALTELKHKRSAMALSDQFACNNLTLAEFLHSTSEMRIDSSNVSSMKEVAERYVEYLEKRDTIKSFNTGIPLSTFH